MRELNSELLTQIDDYLDGQLSKEEHEIFEKAAENDSSLQDLIQEQRVIKSGINNNERAELKLKLDHFHEELYKSEKPQAKVHKLFSMRNIAIAASILMLAVFLIPMLTGPNNLSHEELIFGSGKPAFVKESNIIINGKSNTVKLVVFKKTPAGYMYKDNELLLYHPGIVSEDTINLLDALTLEINGSTYLLQKTSKFTELNIK